MVCVQRRWQRATLADHAGGAFADTCERVTTVAAQIGPAAARENIGLHLCFAGRRQGLVPKTEQRQCNRQDRCDDPAFDHAAARMAARTYLAAER